MINAVRNLLEKRPWTEWLIPSAFCLILLAQLLFSVQQMSQQGDEAIHLYAGYRVLKCSDYVFGREHPPLAKMLEALPLLVSNPPIDCAQKEAGSDEGDATDWLYSQPSWWHLLMEARVAASLFPVALCLGVWIAARRMFGRAVAVVSTAIVAFEPNILGNGPLLLNNVLLTALFLLTVLGFYLWTRQRSLPLLVLTGVFMGMALLTKHPAVLLIPTLGLLAVLEAWLEKSDKTESVRGRAARNLGAVTAILVIAAVTIWCGYGMRYTGGVRRSEGPVTQVQVATMNSEGVRMLRAVRASHLLPQTYLDSLIDVRCLVSSSFTAITLLGRSYTEAPWFYLPLVTTIKFTASFLVMLVLGATGIIAIVKDRRKEILFLLVPALLFLAVAINIKRTAIGMSHLFPMLPFLVILSAAGCVSLARRYRWVGITLVCLLALHAISSLRAYPNYISYANEFWGGPQNLYKHLPWTDVDQTFWQVSRYMEQHPNTPCWLDSGWYVPANMYKVPCVMMGTAWGADVPERMKGIVFISSSWLQVDGQPGGALAIFNETKPTALLGGSAMLVYEGEFDTRIAAARALNNKVFALLNYGDATEALPLAKRSVDLAQSSSAAATAHEMYGVALAFNGQPEEGLLECSTARNLALAERDQQKSEKATSYMKSIAHRYNLLLPPGVQ